jgi:hypothetical protein
LLDFIQSDFVLIHNPLLVVLACQVERMILLTTVLAELQFLDLVPILSELLLGILEDSLNLLDQLLDLVLAVSASATFATTWSWSGLLASDLFATFVLADLFVLVLIFKISATFILFVLR